MKKHSLKSLKKQLRKATDEDLEQIQDEDIQDCLDEGVLVHEGDLTVSGDLDINSGALLVLGNLTVSGEVTTDETGTLVVTGNLQGRHLYLEGNLEIQGKATLSGVVYGFYEAGISRVYGRTTAKLGLIGNHDWACDDEKFKVSGRFSNFSELEEGDPEAIRKLVGDKEFAQLKSMLGLAGEDDEEQEEEDDDKNAAWGLKLFHRV
ncbi:polymer-forming cytoskeletal protein [Myxococcus stipitatus]|uniref:polymer-forming cytoskeletal protein n=1 Tax=Myxococcus stipitatus TaxID=83455 RepID=UPI0031451D13